MNRIHLKHWNVIFSTKICQNSIFDPWRPSWIWRKVIKAFTGLFLWSNSMSMPNFLQIGSRLSKCRPEMWFVGSNLADFWTLTAGSHLGFWEKWKFFIRLVSRIKLYVHVKKFCSNRMKGIRMPSRNVIFWVKFCRFWTFDSRRGGHLEFGEKSKTRLQACS